TCSHVSPTAGPYARARRPRARARVRRSRRSTRSRHRTRAQSDGPAVPPEAALSSASLSRLCEHVDDVVKLQVRKTRTPLHARGDDRVAILLRLVDLAQGHERLTAALFERDRHESAVTRHGLVLLGVDDPLR